MSATAVTALTAVAVILSPAAVSAAPVTRPSVDGAVAGAPTADQQALAAYRRMTTAQRVGQLLMAGVPTGGPSAADRSALRRDAVGNVFLNSNSNASVAAVARVTSRLRAAATYHGVAPFVSTDQEGGQVQRLRGPGFSAIPTALRQGRLAAHTLRSASRRWAGELAAAGVTLDLAPVADTVPAAHAHANQPIGRFDREYGHRPSVVSPHVVAFLRGMSDGHVASTVKHFPGLGRATGNTDTSTGVTDPTGPHSAYLGPFRAAVRAGASMVMASSATYPRIDPHHPACFSSRVLGRLLRHDLGFTKVVISDSMNAVAVSRVPVGQRAVRFLRAGGTVVLTSTTSLVHAMARAVLHRMAAHPTFARLVRHDVLRVLRLKAHRGLLS